MKPSHVVCICCLLHWFGHCYTYPVVNVFWTVLWIAAWLTVWKLTLPLMHWSFVDQTQARSVTLIYVGGALVAPLLIGLWTRTEGDEFWKGKRVSKLLLRIYTHQGAIVGFHTGYLMVFALALLAYYLGLNPASSWFNGLAAIWVAM